MHRTLVPGYIRSVTTRMERLEKRPYHSPSLTSYGSITQLTQLIGSLGEGAGGGIDLGIGVILSLC